MADDPQLDQTQRLLFALMNQKAEQTDRFADVQRTLEAGQSDVIVELPWYPDGGTHQLVLTRIAGDRVVFFNPLGHKGQAPGTTLSDGGLIRRVERDGTESAPLSALEDLFAQGKARALLLEGRKPKGV